MLIETGYALASKDPSCIVLLDMKNASVEGEGVASARRAFDIDHVRRTPFSGVRDAEAVLVSELAAMLRRDGWVI